MIVAGGSSTGIGISRAKFFKKSIKSFSKNKPVDIDSEIKKLEYCIKAANDELNNELTKCNDELLIKVLKKYIYILNNNQMISDIKELITKYEMTAVQAICTIMDDLKNLVEKLDDEYLNEKSSDINEIKYRLLNKLGGYKQDEIIGIDNDCIVVADDITAFDILKMNPSVIKGIVTINGGPTSNSSIIARKKHIPFVSGVGHQGYSIKEGDVLIVDGSLGKVIINPDENVLETYIEKQKSNILYD